MDAFSALMWILGDGKARGSAGRIVALGAGFPFTTGFAGTPFCGGFGAGSGSFREVLSVQLWPSSPDRKNPSYDAATNCPDSPRAAKLVKLRPWSTASLASRSHLPVESSVRNRPPHGPS